MIQSECDPVGQLDRQYPNGVLYYGVQIKPNGEYQKAQGHAIPITDQFDDPTG